MRLVEAAYHQLWYCAPIQIELDRGDLAIEHVFGRSRAGGKGNFYRRADPEFVFIKQLEETLRPGTWRVLDVNESQRQCVGQKEVLLDDDIHEIVQLEIILADAIQSDLGLRGLD